MSQAARRRTWWAAFLALYALEQAALWWLYWGHGAKALAGDEVIYSGWASGTPGVEVFVDSFLWPPLQAWLLHGAQSLTGGDGILLMQVAQSVLLVAGAALLRSFWLACDGRRRAANVAAALFLLNPSTAAYAHWLWPEVEHLFLLLLALRLLQLANGASRGRLLAFAAGVAAGLAMLAKSLLTPFWPFFALMLWRRERPRLDLRAVAALALGVFVVVALPMRHGWQAIGKPMIADSSAFNLVGGLADRWRSDYVGDSVGSLLGPYFGAGTTPAERNAVFMQRAREAVAQEGVVATVERQLGQQYFRLFNAKTLLLSQLSGPACAGYTNAYREPAPALVAALTWASNAAHALTLVAFAFGVALWRRWREPAVWLAALFLAYQMALYLLLHVKARFLLPMLPFLCAFAGSFVASVARAEPGAAVALRGAARWIIGALVAALLLGLAFLGPVLDRSCG